jgi:hypothetical protein
MTIKVTGLNILEEERGLAPGRRGQKPAFLPVFTNAAMHEN